MELAYKFQVNDKKCESPDHYNNYIRTAALCDMKQGYSVTYVYLDVDDETGSKAIAGYITLRANALIFQNESRHHGRAALEIMELAVDRQYAGRNWYSNYGASNI